MRRDGNTLMVNADRSFRGGSDRFFYKGSNRRWEGIYSPEDLALYDEKAAALPPDCKNWLERGGAGTN